MRRPTSSSSLDAFRKQRRPEMSSNMTTSAKDDFTQGADDGPAHAGYFDSSGDYQARKPCYPSRPQKVI